MKILRKIFDVHYELLEKYPALKPLKPLIDAGDNFFFGVPLVTSEKPHIRDGIDLKRFMITVLFAVMPAALASIYFFGLRAIFIILTSYIVGGFTEVIYCIIRKEEVTEGFLITGILFPLIVPITIPLWMVAIGIFIGVLLGKEVFGGTGKNPFNAAIVARCFIYVCFPLQMTGGAFVEPLPNTINTDNWKPKIEGSGGFLTHRGLLKYNKIGDNFEAVSSATPLAILKSKQEKAFDKEASKNDYNEYISYAKKSLPKLFWGNRAGSIGETSAILLILGGLYLIITRVGNWRTIVSTLAAAFIFSFLLYGGETIHDKLYLSFFTLISGGMLFGAIFMTTDPVTGPALQESRYIYGFLIGALAVIIRRYSGFPEGMMYAILLMNIFASLIDEIIILIRYREAK